MKLAAIDIGSNAARILISDALFDKQNKVEFIKSNLIRIPLRLGFDVFENGFISENKSEKLIATIKAFKHLMNVYDVQHLKACATSAMRDAKNAAPILNKIKEETGIEIEVISGQDEASYIYENHIAENMNKDESYLYIDVGGGSTELTFFSDGKMVFKESFNIGTIRLLKNQVTDEIWGKMKESVKNKIKKLHHITAIGSGGNINKVFSLSKKKTGKPLSHDLLRDFYKELNALTVEERISIYHLREDRADVIVPALLIYISIMRWANATEIYVPQIGLADGLIQSLYKEMLQASSSS